MKNKNLGLLVISFLLLLSPYWLYSEYSISQKQIEEIKNLYAEQSRLIDIIYTYSKEKKELLQNLQAIEMERENDLKEKEKLRKEKNNIILEREKDLRKVGLSIAYLEKEKAILKKSLKLSKKQLEEEKKSSTKSWPGIIDIVIWILLFGGGILAGELFGGN